MIGPARQLPLRIAIGEGEAFDSWLLRLAHRNKMPVQWLLPVLGLNTVPTPWRNHALVRDIPTEILRRVETQAGLAPHLLDQAVLDRFTPLGWQPTTGSRYCVSCLTETGGQWPIRWKLPYTFACTRHRCLLAAVCPTCRRSPHSSWSRQSGLLPPHRCTIRANHGDVCGADLLTHPVHTLAPDDPRLSAQQWVNQRLDVMNSNARTDLHDLETLSVWFRQRMEPDDVQHLGPSTVDAVARYRDPQHHHSQRSHQPITALITAAITARAVGLLTADDHSRYGHFTPLFRDANTKRQPASATPPPAPMMLSHKRMTRLSTPLQHKLLTACDPHLPISERLRYGTCTTAPRMTEPGSATATDRARHIPQYLWQNWIIRFQPTTGSHVHAIATDIPAALLIPGNPIRNGHASDELNHWTNNTSQTLRLLADHHPDALTAICALARYLDTHGSPIDYRCRRASFTNVELTRHEWEDLCANAHAHPGKTARQLHARRYLFQLITGADLSNPQHRLAFATGNDKATYLNAFHRALPTPLREALHQHAARLLNAAGINEPLTWSPPADSVAGLTLPGRDPDAINTDALHQAIIVDNLSLTAAAHRLGTSIEHVRYAIRRLSRPPGPHRNNTPPAARQLRNRATAILTHEFFEREYVEAGKDLRTIESETGIHRKLLSHYAHRLNIPITPVRASANIDPDWLREQAETLHRTNGDIAAELGLSHETIRRYRTNLGITNRPTGRSHHRRHPQLPDDIRRAVEGRRHGWQRLRRFQQLVAYPNLSAAGRALGHHASNLNLQLQTLETSIGATLLHRGRGHLKMSPTQAGLRLLQLLDQPKVRDQLDRYTIPTNPGSRRRRLTAD